MMNGENENGNKKVLKTMLCTIENIIKSSEVLP